MKNFNLLTFLGIIIALVFFYQKDSVEVERVSTIKDLIFEIKADIEGISTKIGIDERDKALAYKLQKNIEVWQGTTCIQCHNTLEMALPIHKINMQQAINIVRNGNKRSIAGSMPQYFSRSMRNKQYITEISLVEKLNVLITPNLLKYAKEIEPDVIPFENDEYARYKNSRDVLSKNP